MGLPPSVAAALGLLTDALNDPDGDLHGTLATLRHDLIATVPSYLGLSITVVSDGHPVTISAFHRNAAERHERSPEGIASSLWMPLAPFVVAEAGSQLIFYAARPGAFMDLAADLTFALGIHFHQAVFDRHLSAPPAAVSGLQDWSLINQAIGILIDLGHDPTAARDELMRRATLSGTTLIAVVATLLVQHGPSGHGLA
jgi:hypothetical protein